MTWRWPWVSRSTLDAALAAERERTATMARYGDTLTEMAEERATRAENALAAANEMVATLREQKAASQAVIASQTRELAIAYEQITALQIQATSRAPKHSKLTQAIRDNARGPDGTIDRRLVNHFRTEANKLLRQNMDEDAVIESLSTWQTTETTDRMTPDRMADTFDAPVV
jgi:hypothetical protein